MVGSNDVQHHHRQYATHEEIHQIKKRLKKLEQRLDLFTTGVDRSAEMPQSNAVESVPNYSKKDLGVHGSY